MALGASARLIRNLLCAALLDCLIRVVISSGEGKKTKKKNTISISPETRPPSSVPPRVPPPVPPSGRCNGLTTAGGRIDRSRCADRPWIPGNGSSLSPCAFRGRVKRRRVCRISKTEYRGNRTDQGLRLWCMPANGADARPGAEF